MLLSCTIVIRLLALFVLLRFVLVFFFETVLSSFLIPGLFFGNGIRTFPSSLEPLFQSEFKGAFTLQKNLGPVQTHKM